MSPSQVNAAGADARFVQALLSVQRLVSAGAPTAETYQAIIDQSVRLLGADSGALRLVDLEDPSWTVAVAANNARPTDERWRRRAPITEGLSGQAIQTGGPVVINDLSERPTQSQLAPTGIRAGIGVPLRERGRVIGSISIGSNDPDRRFTPPDVQILADYAKHVGVVLSVARAGHAVEQAFTDPLTGLGNRALLLDRLEHELVRADRAASR